MEDASISQPPATAASPQPPGSLSFQLGAAAILGGLGLFVTLVSLPLALRYSPDVMMKQVRAMSKATRQGAPLPKPMQENLERAQDQMATELAEIQAKVRPLSLAYGAVNLPLSAGLLAGAFMVRARRERGRRLLVGVAWGHLPLHALGITLRIINAIGMGAASAKMMSATMGQVLPGATGFSAAFGTGVQLIGAFFAVGWSLALAGFYVWLALTLRRPEVRRLCA